MSKLLTFLEVTSFLGFTIFTTSMSKRYFNVTDCLLSIEYMAELSPSNLCTSDREHAALRELGSVYAPALLSDILFFAAIVPIMPLSFRLGQP